MGDMTVEELKEKKMWFLWSAKPAKNYTGAFFYRKKYRYDVQ